MEKTPASTKERMRLFGIDINTGFLLTAMQVIAQATGLGPIHVDSKNSQVPNAESLETPDTQQCSASLNVFTEWQHTPQNCDLPPMFVPHFDFLNANTANTESALERLTQTLEISQDKSLRGSPTIRRFPDNIKDDSYFEKSDDPLKTQKEESNFIHQQKRDFQAAVKYAEDNILSPET